MKIFIAARVPRADGQQQALCERAARAVQRSGHTPFLAYQEIMLRDLNEPRVFMPFVRQELESAGLLLLLYDPDLRGGLIEAGIAYAWKKPIWLAYCSSGNAGSRRVSSSSLGVAEQVITYRDMADLEEKLYYQLLVLPDHTMHITEQEN